MGKKRSSADRTPESGISSLFSADNPFRRKPSPPPCPPPKRAAPTVERSPKPKNEQCLNPFPVKNEEIKRRMPKRKRHEIEERYEKTTLGTETSSIAEGETNGGRDGKVVIGKKRKAPDVEGSEAPKEEIAFDDERKLLRTVFVGNLPLKTKRKAILREFEKFGEVESVRIRSVPLVDSKTPRKGAIIQGKVNDAVDSINAYIVFKDEQSANAALSLNMTMFAGNHIRVDMACPPRKKMKGEPPLYDRKRTLFVGNLPFDIKDEELYQLFCYDSESGSSVEAIRVIRDSNTSIGKGIAYVLFKTREAANTMVRKRELKIRDRLIRICHAKTSETVATKRKNPASNGNLPNKRLAMPSGEMFQKNSEHKEQSNVLPYQGLRSSKSGAVKKTRLHTKQNNKHSNQKNERMTRGKERTRQVKRPAVAARKAKQNLKRKSDVGTPENPRQNKKPRKQY